MLHHQRLAALGGRACQLGPLERLARHARDTEATVADHDDVFRCGFEQLGHELLGLLDDELRRLEHRGAAELHRARAAGATATRDERGVGLHVADLLHRHAELVGDDLRERGGVTLAVRRRARLDRDPAVVVHLDLGELGATAGDLDVDRHADAELHAVVALAPLGLLARSSAA